MRENKNMIAIHNHPNSMPPSDKDINACLQNKYKYGLIIGHNGNIFKYSTKKMKEPINEREYLIAVEKFTKMCYNDKYMGQIKALEHLSEIYNFEFKELV